jgi:tetratricopeptide (TPR) repeat protein
MNGFDDLPESIRDVLAQTPYDLEERARRFEVICASAEQLKDDEVAAWAALERARVASGAGEREHATSWCDRVLARAAPAEARAAAVVIRAFAVDEPASDRAPIEQAAEILTARGLWEDAAAAHSYLAQDAVARDDLAGARREYARAIGCAEAGCGRRTGPGYLVDLARVETRLGDPRRALGHLDQALARLEHVLLLFARYTETAAHDALGDAYAALGDAAHAAEAWRETIARYERQERPKAAERVRQKLAALRT